MISILLHATAAIALYCLPLSLTERFNPAGQRSVISIELSFANPSTMEEMPMVIEVADPKLDEPLQAFPVERRTPFTNHPTTTTDLKAFEPAIESADYRPELEVTLSRRVTETKDLPTVAELTEIRKRKAVLSQSTPPTIDLAPLERIVGLSEKTPADLTSNPPPNYPNEAIRDRLQGTVVLRLEVDSTGQVTRVEVVQSSGHASLDQAAVDAVQRWHGQPARRFGKSISSKEVLPIRFRL